MAEDFLNNFSAAVMRLLVANYDAIIMFSFASSDTV